MRRVARTSVEIWESNRYNLYMFVFMILSGFEHRHLSFKQFKQLFDGYSARFEKRNNYDHFHSRPILSPVVELLKRLSLLVPAYNVASVDIAGNLQPPSAPK